MEYRTLGKTDINVSVICLGTMTWGEQNTEAEAFKQMDYAFSQGVNFFDTAELYSIPPRAETCGSTETIIGKWLKQRGIRDRIILASKIAGPGEWLGHIRNGKTAYNSETIAQALEGNLARLQTDYIDLYQLHWPERKTNFFGQLGYTTQQDQFTPIHETLEALKTQVDAGKIRYIGLSNETPWGVYQFLKLADEFNLPRVVSIQNPYSLLNRTYEIGLAEISARESCGLLAYSPLGFGVLSGKYLRNKKPSTGRVTLWPEYSRYSNPRALKATEKYVTLANENQLNPAQMALAYVNSRPFLTSTIIGATTMQQLEENIKSVDIKLDKNVVSEIDKTHESIPNPSP